MAVLDVRREVSPVACLKKDAPAPLFCLMKKPARLTKEKALFPLKQSSIHFTYGRKGEKVTRRAAFSQRVFFLDTLFLKEHGTRFGILHGGCRMGVPDVHCDAEAKKHAGKEVHRTSVSV
ncbi:MAG TPA: hypothetical protein VF458_03600 [Ktedonobacteraceae bacterium]